MQNRKDMNLSKINNVSTFLANGSDNSVHMLLMLFTILFSQFIYKFTKILQQLLIIIIHTTVAPRF